MRFDCGPRLSGIVGSVRTALQLAGTKSQFVLRDGRGGAPPTSLSGRRAAGQPASQHIPKLETPSSRPCEPGYRCLWLLSPVKIGWWGGPVTACVFHCGGRQGVAWFCFSSDHWILLQWMLLHCGRFHNWICFRGLTSGINVFTTLNIQSRREIRLFPQFKLWHRQLNG